MNQELINIIKEVKEKISDGSDMVWTKYENAKQLRDELDDCIERLKVNDTNCLEQIKFLFLPTASLQEHSISNCWAEEYLTLSKRFDDLYSKNRG
jgi:hypothetical protein